MPFDNPAPQIGGSLLLVSVAYAALSVWGTGQVVAERTLQKSGLIQQCERGLVQSVKRDTPELQSVPPKLKCNDLTNIIIGDGFGSNPYCKFVDILLDQSPARQIEVKNRRLVAAYKERVANAAANAGSKCACASHVVQSERVPWAIYAGSWRIVKPAELNNLDAKLSAALNSPLCGGVER